MANTLQDIITRPENITADAITELIDNVSSMSTEDVKRLNEILK